MWGVSTLALVLGGVGLGVWLQGEESPSSGEVEVEEELSEGERVRGAGSLAEVEGVEGWWGEAVAWARLLDAGESPEGLERWLGAPAEDVVVRALLEGRRAYVEGEVVSLEEWAEGVRWEEAGRWAEEARGRRLAAQESWGAARGLIPDDPRFWEDPEQAVLWGEVHELWSAGDREAAIELSGRLPRPTAAGGGASAGVGAGAGPGRGLSESMARGPELLVRDDAQGLGGSGRWISCGC